MTDSALRDGGATAWQRREVSSPDGLTLSVLVAADGGAGLSEGLPPVLALHGFASSAAAGWGRTGHLDTLVRAGRAVIALDLRGHGESGKPHDVARYSAAAVLADIAAAHAALAPGAPVDLIGYSLGSRLAWTVACRGILPVRRLVLGGFDGRPLFHDVDTERLDRLAAGVPGNDRIALRALVAGLSGAGRVVRTGHDESPAVPTLIVAGDQDPLASGARECAAALPAGHFLSIPGRNHISTVPSRVYRQAEVDFLAAG